MTLGAREGPPAHPANHEAGHEAIIGNARRLDPTPKVVTKDTLMSPRWTSRGSIRGEFRSLSMNYGDEFSISIKKKSCLFHVLVLNEVYES
jgi:hypothetical protein